MRQVLVTACVGVLGLGFVAAAVAGLCDKCKDGMYIQSIGTCTSCGGHTTSGAFKLCPKCSEKQGKCEHCLAALPGAAKTPADKKPDDQKPDDKKPDDKKPDDKKPDDKPQPVEKIDLSKSGEYKQDKWSFGLTVHAAGTPREGRSGWLKYDDQAVPRGDLGDYYDTPWGPMSWRPMRESLTGDSGWLPRAGAAKAGKELVPPNAQKKLTDADDGKKTTLAVGEYLVISLPGNPTTGYSWKSASPPGDSLKAVGEPAYAQTPGRAGMVGVGGTFVFKFKAVKAGKAEVKLAYARPWEKDKPPIKTFSAPVEVE
jgi:inhibitor of cysteine peptidase